MVKPLSAHWLIVDHRHSVVDSTKQRVGLGSDDGERVEHVSRLKVLPRIPQPRERERLFVL